MRVNGKRWAAASGYVVILFGVAGAAFERGGLPPNAPVEQTIAFLSTYRRELLFQSLMFVLSAGAHACVACRDHDCDGREVRPHHSCSTRYRFEEY
jgi:hypothetical protein